MRWRRGMHAQDEREGRVRGGDVRVVNGAQAKLSAAVRSELIAALVFATTTMSVLNAVQNDDTAFSKIPIMFARSLYSVHQDCSHLPLPLET